jgi:uncharacterized membrane protein
MDVICVQPKSQAMNQTHIHLLITHLPIFGSIIGALVLLHAIWKKSDETKVAAYNVFILSGIGAGIAYLTGEGAEEGVEDLPGVAKSMIETHEDFAGIALVSIIILGVLSIIGVVMSSKKASYSGTLSSVILFISLISFGLFARTGYLGGQIRHTELSSVQSQNPSGESQSEKDDD